MTFLDDLAAAGDRNDTVAPGLRGLVERIRCEHPLNDAVDEIRRSGQPDGLRKRVNAAVRALKNDLPVVSYGRFAAAISAEVVVRLSVGRHSHASLTVTAQSVDLLHKAQAALLSAGVPVVAVTVKGELQLTLARMATCAHETDVAVSSRLTDEQALAVLDAQGDDVENISSRRIKEMSEAVADGLTVDDAARAVDLRVPSCIAQAAVAAGYTIERVAEYYPSSADSFSDVVGWIDSPYSPRVRRASVLVLDCRTIADFPTALTEAGFADADELLQFFDNGGRASSVKAFNRSRAGGVERQQRLTDAALGLLDQRTQHSLTAFKLTIDQVRPFFAASKHLRNVTYVKAWIDGGFDAPTAAQWANANKRLAQLKDAQQWIDAAAPLNDPQIAGKLADHTFLKPQLAQAVLDAVGYGS